MTYTLLAWTPQPGNFPVKDEPANFTDLEAADEAYSERRTAGPGDLVILYKDGQKRPVRHSNRKGA